MIDKPCFIIAEVGQTHDGSLGQAHAFIDAIARAGASAVKFQTHIAEAESSHDEPFRVKFSPQDMTRYDYWKRMEFTPEQWAALKMHADERGLVFMSTPFSLQAFELLRDLDVAAWKVGSGELGSTEMIDGMAATGNPIYLSTGLSSYDELRPIVDRLRACAVDLTLMQCTTKYPCPLDQVGLNVMIEYRNRFDCRIGLSDHSASVYPSLAAVALGASAIEVHVAFSREQFGPDVSASLTFDELRNLVEGVRAIETVLQNPVDKDRLAQELKPVKVIFGKSACLRRALLSGHTLRHEDISMLKPGGGLDEKGLLGYIGRPISRPLPAGHRLSPEDFD